MKNNLAKYLNMRGMTQAQLAEKVGTTEVSICRYVAGQREPKVSMAIKIARALETSIYVLWEA